MREPDERDHEMRRLRLEEKMTLREIGEHFGISAERMRQRLRECFNMRGVRRARKNG